MKVKTNSLQQLCFYAGAFSLLIPVVGYTTPTVSNPATFFIAQANAASSAQTFQSRELGFRIDVPQNYAVDTSQKNEGVVTFRNQSVPQAVGSDQPAPDATATTAAAEQPQAAPNDAIRVATFENPKRLSAADWAKQNEAQSFINGRQSEIQQRQFAGQPAVSYSWCASSACGDSIIVPSRDRRQIFVLSALYDFPGDSVRWDFQTIAGRFRFVQ